VSELRPGRRLYALVDCNNFYVSCERLFDPALRERPVVVLSNNDGCVIARSDEVKAMGVKMAEPYFKVAEFLRGAGVRVFSSNYALYGDISRRVMDTLAALEPAVEVYSIDEAFISLPMMAGAAARAWAGRVRRRVLRDVGIPVSIGIAPTKTLAKAAGREAKKAAAAGIHVLVDRRETATVLAAMPVGDVWGVGRRSEAKLLRRGARTALDMRRLPDTWLRKYLGTPGYRTALELRGISCVPRERACVSGKSVLSSRSFKYPVTSLADLREAAATHASLAAEKLRARGLAASCLHVFARTNPRLPRQPQYRGQCAVDLAPPTSHGRSIVRAALAGIERLYRSGYRYQKAGVMLTGLTTADRVQRHLFIPDENDALMAAMDYVNSRWGRDTIRFAATGLVRPWAMRRDFRSPSYTTDWRGLPVATA